MGVFLRREYGFTFLRPYCLAHSQACLVLLHFCLKGSLPLTCKLTSHRGEKNTERRGVLLLSGSSVYLENSAGPESCLPQPSHWLLYLVGLGAHLTSQGWPNPSVWAPETFCYPAARATPFRYHIHRIQFLFNLCAWVWFLCPVENVTMWNCSVHQSGSVPAVASFSVCQVKPTLGSV